MTTRHYPIEAISMPPALQLSCDMTAEAPRASTCDFAIEQASHILIKGH